MAISTEVRFSVAASLPLNGSFQSHQSKANSTDAVSKKTTRILEKQPLSKAKIMAMPSIRKDASVIPKPVDKGGTIKKMQGVGQKQLQKPESRASNHAERAKEFDRQSLSNGKKRKREENSESEAKNSAKRARIEDQPHELRVENSAPKSKLPPKLKAKQEKSRQQVAKTAGVVASLPREGARKKEQNPEILKTRVSLPPKKRISGQVSQASKGIDKTAKVAKKLGWTTEDDQQLLKGHETYGNNWALISQRFPLS